MVESEDSTNMMEQAHDEIDSHFSMRKQVYERAIHDGKTPEEAALTANIFRNMYFLGCGYPQEVMTATQKYWDPEWI